MHSLLDTFPLAIFAVSVLSAKAVHLHLHAETIPWTCLVLYLPSLVLQDACLLLIVRSILGRGKAWISLIGSTIMWPFCLISLFAASSQIGFFYETGGEMEWEDARTFATDAEGIKVLLSGSRLAATVATAILVVSWITRSIIFRLCGDGLTQIKAILTPIIGYIARCFGLQIFRYDTVPTHDRDQYSDEEQMPEGRASPEPTPAGELSSTRIMVGAANKSQRHGGRTGRACCAGYERSWVTVVVIVFLSLTTLWRPRKPYNHMSYALPVLMLEIFRTGPDSCEEQEHINGNQWPFPDQIERTRWLAPDELFKGWAPGPDNSFARLYRKRVPDWLPNPVPHGFQRWDPWRFENDRTDDKEGLDLEAPPSLPEHPHFDTRLRCGENGTQDKYYNPVSDPLRISNLDQEIHPALRPVLEERSVTIRHVVLVLMESLRSEVFPIQSASDLHKFIMESHEPQDRDAINARLSKLSPNSERITGIRGNFRGDSDLPYQREASAWRRETETNFGGINVVGALSPSSASTKSLAVAHCGVWPMAVDDFEESETESYQPCLPQIFDLFNAQKEGKGKADSGWREQQWVSGFFQATTDDYDRQGIFDDKIGFEHIVNKKRIIDDIEQYPGLEDINYFGYPETSLRPYIEDFTRNVQANDQRMFLSHFTSTTHHPWGTPEWFNKTEYLRTDGMQRWHKDFDDYLNAIRFHDAWLGELMQIFDDAGMMNETLVVFASDHGQAFREDTSKTGTYENGHISNFRVGLTFWHSQLPRYQYQANVTSISVLPTILDLLISTGSLNTWDENAASDLIHDYEGQSLIRPYMTKDGERRAWNFGVVNPGGGMLTITSADTPFRLIMPLGQEFTYSFTDLDKDPHELRPIAAWSVETLASTVGVEHSAEASSWVMEAKMVADWWRWERKRLWGGA